MITGAGNDGIQASGLDADSVAGAQRVGGGGGAGGGYGSGGPARLKKKAGETSFWFGGWLTVMC